MECTALLEVCLVSLREYNIINLSKMNIQHNASFGGYTLYGHFKMIS